MAYRKWLDKFRVNNRFGVALGRDSAFAHGDDVVGVAISLVNVVKYRDEGHALFAVESEIELTELDLLGWVVEPDGLI